MKTIQESVRCEQPHGSSETQEGCRQCSQAQTCSAPFNWTSQLASRKNCIHLWRVNCAAEGEVVDARKGVAPPNPTTVCCRVCKRCKHKAAGPPYRWQQDGRTTGWKPGQHESRPPKLAGAPRLKGPLQNEQRLQRIQTGTRGDEKSRRFS